MQQVLKQVDNHKFSRPMHTHSRISHRTKIFIFFYFILFAIFQKCQLILGKQEIKKILVRWYDLNLLFPLFLILLFTVLLLFYLLIAFLTVTSTQVYLFPNMFLFAYQSHLLFLKLKLLLSHLQRRTERFASSLIFAFLQFRPCKKLNILRIHLFYIFGFEKLDFKVRSDFSDFGRPIVAIRVLPGHHACSDLHLQYLEWANEQILLNHSESNQLTGENSLSLLKNWLSTRIDE